MRTFIGALLGAVLLAGCSPGAAEPDASGLAKTEQIGQAAVHFAQCMRDRGYPVPDPTYDGDGLPRFGEMPGVVKDAGFEEVRQSCGEPLVAALQAAGVPNKKEVDPEELLGFARCMREHGIDIPDPTAEELLEIPKSAFNSPAWQAAAEACESLLPESWRGILEPQTGPDVKQGGGGR
jgi:hypothetical protein